MIKLSKIIFEIRNISNKLLIFAEFEEDQGTRYYRISVPHLNIKGIPAFISSDSPDVMQIYFTDPEVYGDDTEFEQGKELKSSLDQYNIPHKAKHHKGDNYFISIPIKYLIFRN